MVRVEVIYKYYKDNSKRAYKVVKRTIQIGRKKRRYWDLSDKYSSDYSTFRNNTYGYEDMDFDTKQTEFLKILYENKKISKATFYRYKKLMKSQSRWKEFSSEALNILIAFLKLFFYLKNW